MSHFQAEDLRAMFSFPSAKAMSQIMAAPAAQVPQREQIWSTATASSDGHVGGQRYENLLLSSHCELGVICYCNIT